MSTKYLGDTFDIHGGGMDLVFPHHECEIAQSVSHTGHDPAKYWMHTNMLTVNGQKMSKSLGNSFLPHELFSGNHELLERGYSPMVVRFFMLQSHYSSTLDFSNEALSAAEKGYKRLMEGIRIAQQLTFKQENPDTSFDTEVQGMIESLFTNLSDDFNTAKGLAVLFEMTTLMNNFKTGNRKLGTLSEETFDALKQHYCGVIKDVLGLTPEIEEDSNLLEGTVDILMTLRLDARRQKNYALADQIRDDLKKIGITLKDGKDGTEFSVD
jgi:cysteinyl-tRNA synthetase